jgi:hypothetical protein
VSPLFVDALRRGGPHSPLSALISPEQRIENPGTLVILADGSTVDLNDLYTESDGKKRVARAHADSDLGGVVECLKLKLREMQALVFSSEQRVFELEQQLENEKQTTSDMHGELIQERLEARDAVTMLEGMCKLPIFEERHCLMEKLADNNERIRQVCHMRIHTLRVDIT